MVAHLAVTLDHNYNFEFFDDTVISFIQFIGKHIFCRLNFRKTCPLILKNKIVSCVT